MSRADPSHAIGPERVFCDIKQPTSWIRGWVKHAATAAGDADSQGFSRGLRERKERAARRVVVSGPAGGPISQVSANLLRRTSCPGPWAPRHSRASATDDLSWLRRGPGCGPARFVHTTTGVWMFLMRLNGYFPPSPHFLTQTGDLDMQSGWLGKPGQDMPARTHTQGRGRDCERTKNKISYADRCCTRQPCRDVCAWGRVGG